MNFCVLLLALTLALASSSAHAEMQASVRQHRDTAWTALQSWTSYFPSSRENAQLRRRQQRARYNPRPWIRDEYGPQIGCSHLRTDSYLYSIVCKGHAARTRAAAKISSAETQPLTTEAPTDAPSTAAPKKEAPVVVPSTAAPTASYRTTVRHEATSRATSSSTE